MRKFKLFLSLLMLMCIGVTQMWGGEVTISPSQALNDGGVDPISIVCAKGDGTSNPAISSGQLRLYQANSGKTTGNTITFSSESTITQIVFTFANNMTASYGVFSVGEYDAENFTWSGSATSVTLTCTGTKSGERIYITEMVVTYDGGSTPPADPFMVTLKDDDTELTEETAGAGVTLPSRDGCEGYTFAGWTKTWTSAQSSWTTTAPEIIPAGAYTPAADENLYPVYTKEEGGSGSASPTTKSMTSFDAISGNVESDENISYAAAQGTAGTAPAVNGGEIRIYQNGGLLTISANNGKKLTEITIGSSMGTTVTYAIDGGEASSNQSISANGTFTLDNIEATSVVFTCTGTSKTTRLYLNNLSVTYSGGGSGSTTYYISEPDCSTPTPPAPTCEKLGTPVVSVPAEFLTYNSAKLTWAAVANADKYLVKFNGENQEATSNLYFDATGLNAATAYSYQVKAIAAANQDAWCDGEFSTSTQLTTKAAPALAVAPESWDFETVATDAAASKVFSVSGTNLLAGDLTITVPSGYSVEPASITMAAAGNLAATNVTVSKNTTTAGTYNDNMTISGCGLAADVTIALSMTVAEKYTVKFNTGAGNPAQADVTEAAPTAGITLPAGPTPKCVADGWAFAGWAKAAVGTETTSAPALLSGTYHPEANNETLYAVYSRSEEGGSLVWAKMTSNPQVGDAVLLVNEDAKVEAKDKTQAKYITVEEYETTPAGLLPWTLETGNSEGTFSFKNGDVYLNLPGASNELRQSAEKTNNSSWTISVANDGTATITNVAYTARVIKYNSGSPRFACYESGQQAIQLYKQTAASTTYYLSAPACCDKHAIAIASGIENGTVEADLTEACEGATVTLTFTPAGSHHLDSWSVNGTAQDVAENTFTMPATAVTVSATFVHDACANLVAPTKDNDNFAISYNSATIAWSELTGAESYAVSVVKHGEEEPIFSGSVSELSKALADLEPETQYDYSIMAVGDGTDYCAEGNPALEGNFTTAALPEVKLTLMVGGAEDDRSANHPILTAFELPSTASVDNCPKVFVGWSADADRTTAPEFAPGAEFTFEDETPATLYAVFAKEGEGQAVTYPIDFEADAATYTNWTFNNMVSNYSNSGVTAHGGNKYGSTDGKATASVTTAAQIANPTSITFYVSKQSNNSNASTWYVEVSADGSDWTEVESADAASMDKGVWNTVSADLSSYSNVYVRVYYEGSTAIRDIDDLVLSAVGPATYSEYSTECEACKAVTLVKAGENQEKGNTFALKVGEDVVASVQTCEAASVTIEPTVATGYQVSFAISELEGASLSENTISLAKDAEGELTVTATFTQKNYVVTLAQNPAAGATLVGGKEDAHYNETINLSTDVPAGYEFINWTSENVEITNATSATGASFTMPDADVTVTANFGKVYTVSFNAGSDPITETAIGAGVELPAGPALSQACQDDGWDFAGWAEAAVAEQTTTAPELNAAGATYHPTTDIELFAVYKKDVAATTPETKYVKTALTDIEDGSEVVITELYSNTIYAAANDGGTSAGPSEIELTETEDVLNIGDNSNIFWTISKDGDNFSFAVKGGTNKLYCTNSNNGVRVGTNENNVFSIKDDYLYNNATSRYVGYNHESGGLFRCYTSINTNINNETLVFYKATSVVPTTTYYLSAPECCTPHAIVIADTIKHGTVEADTIQACAGATITLTPKPATNYHFVADSWVVSYNDGEEVHNVAVENNQFEMPAYNVTVGALFAHDDCTPLDKPANVAVVVDYKSAILGWDEVEHANHYVVTIAKGDDIIEGDTIDANEYDVVATLLANTTYTFKIQAIADDSATYCKSALVDSSFTTEPLPTYTLTLMENEAERAEDEEYTKLHELGVEFALPTSAAAACTGKVFVGWSNTENIVGGQALLSAIALTQDTTLYAVYATAGAGQATTLFSETFDDCAGKGANDANGWSGSIASSNLTADNDDWTFVKGNGAYQCAKFGTGSAKGSAQTPEIVLTGSATLTFKAGAWNGGSEGTTLNISATNAKVDKASVTMTKGAWTTYTITIYDVTGPVQIKFEAQNASNNRFFLDDVVVSQSAVVYSDSTTSCTAALDAPTFSLSPAVEPVEDEYKEAINVVITNNAGEGSKVYYTLDGTNPTNESTEYTEPIALNTCGEKTIKAIAISATSQSAVVEATYTIAIPIPTNSEVEPYSPTQAIDVIASGCHDESTIMYVKGVVKSTSAFSPTYGNYDVVVRNIGDESPEAPTFTYYHMYAAPNKVKFTEDEQIAAGDTILAAGVLTLYGSTYEFATNTCYMVEHKKFVAEKQHIANTQDNPYTVAQAINFCDNAINYDLTDSVYVQGVVTNVNSTKTIFVHDAGVENEFQFFHANLNDFNVEANDTVIAKGLILKYNATTYEMAEGGIVVEVKKAAKFTVNPTAVAFGDVEKGATVNPIEVDVELTAISNATVTLAGTGAGAFSIDVTSLNANGTITVTPNTDVDAADYADTITLHDVAGVATDVKIAISMKVTQDPRKKAQDLDGFDAISGNLNEDIAFASYKGGGTADPNVKDHTIQLYQIGGSNVSGGYISFTAAHGCKIDQVKITTAKNATDIAYAADGELSETTENVLTGAEYLTAAELNAETVNIYCMHSNSGNRLFVATATVYYTGDAVPVHHKAIDITGMEASQFEFPKNGTFTHEGLKVYACYDENCEDKVDITTDCHVDADLTTTGEKKAKVYYGEEFVDEYDINVIAGQDDPALAYTPAVDTIAAADVASWTAPEFSNPLGVSPINFSSNNQVVATVDENGVIALAGGYGTAKITASFDETEDYIASVATYTITVQEPANKIDGDWRIVTSTADLTVGSKVIIVGTKNETKYAMGEQKSNNRAAVAVVSETEGVIKPAEGTKTFTLVDAGDGNYAFKANNGKYLYAAGSTNLREQATINGNASWTITITGDVTTIEANGTSTNKSMRLNPNGSNAPLFSSYVSGQNPVTLYVNRTVIPGSDDPEHPADSVEIDTNVEEEEIVVSGNIVVTVDASNFEEPKSYIAQDGATIIVTNTDEAKSVIADSTSTIEVSQPITVNEVFSVAATMGSGHSGQITGASNVTIAENTEAYFDITLGDNANPQHWHAFAVPFPVDAINGIYDAKTGAKLANEVNYAIMDYHGDIRATGAYGWKKFRGIMQPGVFYLMTVDGNTKTFRFKMSGLDLMNVTQLALQLNAATGEGQSTDAGWNGVANPTLEHGAVNQTVTVLNPSTYTYEDKDAGEYNFVVGTPFFIQADAQAVADGMTMGAVVDGKPYYAPKQVSENGIEKIRVFFGNAQYQDKLTISANEEALNEYQVGKDLIKMTMTSTPKVAQIFGNAYGTKLCRANLPLVNDAVSMDVDLYAPQAGEYTIATSAIEGYDVYLTREDAIIWNLSTSEYTADFEKGNNAGYGIRIVKAPKVATSLDNLYENVSGVQKLIIDEHVYILRDEKMYDVNGKLVK